MEHHQQYMWLLQRNMGIEGVSTVGKEKRQKGNSKTTAGLGEVEDDSCEQQRIYPLVNVYTPMENNHFSWETHYF